MIVAIKASTRAFSAVARSANTHPRVVMLALVAIAVSIIVIAVARRLFAVDTAEHAEDLLRCSGRWRGLGHRRRAAIAIPSVSFRPAQLLSHH